MYPRSQYSLTSQWSLEKHQDGREGAADGTLVDGAAVGGLGDGAELGTAVGIAVGAVVDGGIDAVGGGSVGQ